MKKIISALVTTLIVLGCQHTYALEYQNSVMQGSSFFSPRSQSTDAARDIVGWHPFIHRVDAKSCYFTFAAVTEYTKSFHADRIAQAIFGVDVLNISGSQITNRGDQDILADYFGLSPIFQSIVQLNPSIQNFIMSFNGYAGFDGFIPGLYLEIFAPVVWTRWNFELQEDVLNETQSEFPPNYMAAGSIVPPVTSFTDALKGTTTFGQMTDPLAFGKVCGPQSKWGLSDVQFVLGYDICSSYRGYAGANVRFTVPTGTRPKSEFLFEPVVGNGKHWELGGGFSGSFLLWEKNGTHELALFLDLTFMHLFKSRQRRSFDFCENGFGSRYILMKEFDADGNYNGTLLPAINKTSLCCDVSIDIQTELLVMFGYTHKSFTFDIGYNGWIRSKEKICLVETVPSNKYGLKGIQNVTNDLGQNINTTQSTATFMGNEFTNQALVADPNPPVFISTSDLDLGSAASTRMLTNKLFINFSHAWQKNENDRVVPYLGGGTSVEFEGINSSVTVKPDHTTLSQWGVWLKGGIAFS